MSGGSIAVKGGVLLALVSALVPVACSGDSKSSGGAGRGGTGADAGAPSAATGGSSGGALAGGSGGSSGSGRGGSAGKAGVGGSAGQAGSTSSAGGASGEGGASDAAGSPGASGTGTAGDSASGGMAGAGAMRGYHPPDEQIEACTSMCEREAEANCSNEGTEQECFEGCRVGIQFEPCSAGWEEMFACVETAAPFTCNAGGEATAPECVTEYAEVIDCVFNENLDPSFAVPCNEYCDANDAAGCQLSEPTAECSNTCVILASAFPVCAGVYQDFLECGAAADIICDEQGEPTAEGCASEYVLFLSCLVSEYDWQL